MRSKIYFWALIVSLWMVVVACSSDSENQIIFPTRDIVFHSSQDDIPSIGFINIDGTGLLIYPSKNYVHRPVWVTPDLIVFLEVRENSSTPYRSPANLWYWHSGEKQAVCSNYRQQFETRVTPSGKQGEVFVILGETEIELLSGPNFQGSCVLIESTVDYSAEDGYSDRRILDLNYSSEAKVLLFTEIWDYYTPRVSLHMIALNLTNQESHDIGEGFNPALSHDGALIAFVRFDGIYLAPIDNLSDASKIVTYDSTDNDSFGILEDSPPAPLWSSDDRYLLYHKCDLKPEPCRTTSDFSIFLFDLATGEESKIIDGGLSPFWRP